jgi:predicted nucleic acid-binding protein
MTVLEIWRGARDYEFEATAALIAACTIVTLTGELAEQAGRLSGRMRAEGRVLGAADAAIAATALAVAAKLWTTNAKDFVDVPGLAVVPVVLA